MDRYRQIKHLNVTDDLVQKVIGFYQNHEEVPYISPDRDLESWVTSVELGVESLVPKRNMIRLEDDCLPGHIILLWRIGFGTFTNESVFPKYFEYDYGIHAEEALEDIQQKGYARKLTAYESLNYLPATHLKAFLKKKGVKGYSTLKKEELMVKVKETFTEEELASLFNVRGFELTHLGKQKLEAHSDVVDRHPKKSY